jgi:hypothetical protein
MAPPIASLISEDPVSLQEAILAPSPWTRRYGRFFNEFESTAVKRDDSAVKRPRLILPLLFLCNLLHSRETHPPAQPGGAGAKAGVPVEASVDRYLNSEAVLDLPYRDR